MKPNPRKLLDLPAVEYLHECFSLDQTGALTWKERPRHHFATERGWRTFNTQRAGNPVGTESEGYLLVALNKRLYKVHRIVFAMANGVPPTGEVDHRDCHGLHNAPGNLRDATPTQNQLNKRKSSKRDLPKCVYPKGNKFQVKMRAPGSRQITIGCFDTVEAAKMAHAQAVSNLHGEFGRVD